MPEMWRSTMLAFTGSLAAAARWSMAAPEAISAARHSSRFLPLPGRSKNRPDAACMSESFNPMRVCSRGGCRLVVTVERSFLGAGPAVEQHAAALGARRFLVQGSLDAVEAAD